MKTLLYSLMLLRLCDVSAMQHHHHKVIVIDLPSTPDEVKVIDIEGPARQTSQEREQVRYNHRRNIALIGLATALIGGTATLTVFLAK
jgi:hypothetical protein